MTVQQTHAPAFPGRAQPPLDQGAVVRVLESVGADQGGRRRDPGAPQGLAQGHAPRATQHPALERRPWPQGILGTPHVSGGRAGLQDRQPGCAHAGQVMYVLVAIEKTRLQPRQFPEPVELGRAFLSQFSDRQESRVGPSEEDRQRRKLPPAPPQTGGQGLPLGKVEVEAHIDPCGDGAPQRPARACGRVDQTGRRANRPGSGKLEDSRIDRLGQPEIVDAHDQGQ